MKTICLAVALLLLCAWPVGASVTGSIGFASPILSSADASPTGDINTSNLFTIQNLVTTGNDSGIFAGMPVQAFGNVSFDTHVGTSLLISDTSFGTFQSNTIMTVTSFAGFLNLLLSGTWTPGTFNSGIAGTFPANFRISFTQSPAATGEISFSGTMGVQSVVPEPSTWLLCLTGVGMILGGAKLRKLWV